MINAFLLETMEAAPKAKRLPIQKADEDLQISKAANPSWSATGQRLASYAIGQRKQSPQCCWTLTATQMLTSKHFAHVQTGETSEIICPS